MRAAIRRRWKFLGQAIPAGAKPLLSVVGVTTIIIGGSLLSVFLDDFWAGAFIVTLFAGLALGEGMFRLWERTAEAAESQAAEPPSLPDLLHALLEDGVARREKVEVDPDWGIVHTHSGLQAWRQNVTAVLEEEVPGLALWFHQMESPGIALRRVTDDGPKEQHLAAFDWDLDRLADIEAMVRANAPGGHPDGERRTRELLLLERALRLLQEIRLLSRQLPGGMLGTLGQMDSGIVNERVSDCTSRARQLLTDMVGDADAEQLIAHASVDPAMLRAGIDPEGARLMAVHHIALREAMSRGYLESLSEG